MGAHRAIANWQLALRRHLVWIVAALAVLGLTVAISYASRPGGLDGPDAVATGELPLYPSIPGDGHSSIAANPGWSVAAPSTPASSSASPGASPSASRTPSGRPAPRPQPSAASRPPTTPPPSATALPLTADYTVSSAWTTGYVASIVVRNPGATATAWILEIRLPSGVTIVNGWNATFVVSGTTVRVTPPRHQTRLAPGGAITLGYRVVRTNPSNEPRSCTVNGSPCR
ncbi:MAG: hypothetical protein HKP61_06680 [Dactylosporangium sp.]|nr:cellulose-binding domain-containing protein [Dactylosporangium sp.]NNJ60629.1 hypothetical protein [Dactylosporangium sp.]